MASTTTGRSSARVALVASGHALLALVAAACSGGGGTTGGSSVDPNATSQVASVEFGRIADVYGFRSGSGGQVIELFRKDVMIGRDIRDERVPGTASEGRTDAEIRYDFIGNDPDTLQPRLLIPRQIGSVAFDQLVADLDNDVTLITPMLFGQSGVGRPFSVVPRNASVRLTFTTPHGVSDEFFVERNQSGVVTGLRNTEAVQLLQIAGDPSQAGNFVPLPVRVIVASANTLILDPVLLGSEGQQYQAQNNASGMPASPDSFGANIRVALALDGPLAMPGLRSDSWSGLNNSGRNSVVRDFRSGNEGDSGPDLARGFVLDNEPPRLVGEMPMYLERVDVVDAATMRVRVWKGGIQHEVDRGDVFRFMTDSSNVPFGTTEVVVDPADDLGQPSVQHVDVLIRTVLDLETIDPSNRADYPTDPLQLEAWLRSNAPRAVLVAEYQGGRVDLNSGAQIVLGDDPRYFGLFTPEPTVRDDGTPSDPNENVSPFAGALIRFTKPVDLSTVKSADTFYIATRDLVDTVSREQFIATRPWRVADATGAPSGVGMATSAFDLAKYRTPHLIGARVVDETGSQTVLRLQPLNGLYLDSAMRQDGPRPYYLHVLAGIAGIRDLSGNPIDLQTNDANRAQGLVIPFTLDTRASAGRPNFEDNLAVYVVRANGSVDEDENPSYYLPEEVQGAGAIPNARATPLADVFGAFSRVNGRIEGRPTSRLRRVADSLNQAPVEPQASILRYCPEQALGEQQVVNQTATAPIGLGLQNPFNPYGCRLQTVWREIDLSLSRTDPFDFNLDIEQMYWAPFTGAPIEFDEFDKVTLRFGHSERRPEPCLGNFSALPTFPDSGLSRTFDNNWVRNLRANTTTNEIESRPLPHDALANTPSNMRINAADVVLEPNQRNRFLPLPTFRRPYFVYRDETVMEQGGSVLAGSDVNNSSSSFPPWILSPWNHGIGRRAVQDNAGATPIAFLNGFWHSGNNYLIRVDTSLDRSTEGLLGSVALPLLADFLVECDSSQLPAGNGYVAFGLTGWQTSVSLQSSARPDFRVFTAGRPPFPNLNPICREPTSSATALGGYAPPPPIGQGGVTEPGDNTFYWVMIDFLKRASVVTNGFIDLYNPHRVPNGFADSRLGPYYTNPQTGAIVVPSGVRPRFSFEFDPPSTLLPGGTSVIAQFRGASAVDPDPWYWREWAQGNIAAYPTAFTAQLRTTDLNFPLDPFKAADAHIRKFDDRQVSGVARNWWTYFYNRTVTSYVLDPNQLQDANFLARFNGPNEGFTPNDVRYINWRYLMSNNIDANPPVAPSIDTFILSYRFQRVQ